MFDRGNGVRASKSVSVGVGREALLRKALLGSTALIGIGLVATPAMAQTTIVSPSGGGTIQRTGGSNPTVDNQTGSGGGVLITNVTGSTGLQTNGVTIANTTGAPNANGLDVEGSTSGLNTTGMVFAGTNNISTTVTGGSAYYMQTNANMGITFLSGGSTFTGSYGLNLSAPAGYISLESTGFNQSFVGNGSAAIGINAISSVNAGLQIGGSSITGFATGVNAQNYYGTSFTSTGGTINANSIGMRFIATGGGSTVNSQSAITAINGIMSNDVTGSTITTSGTGTINAVTSGSGVGISVASTGSGVTTVNVGAAIGNTTAFGTGVSLTTGSPSTATLNITTTAAITATNYGLALQAWAPAGRGTIDIGANITAGTAIYNTGGVYDYIIRSGATVTSTAAGSPALSSGNSTSTLNNAGTLRATGAGAAGFQGFGIQTITNSGTIDGAAQGIAMVNTTTINNTGTIQGGTAGGIQGSIGTVNNTGAGALITGNTGITSTTNPLTVVNSGTITGATWGIVSGGTLTSITSSGTISGATGAIQLNATGTQSVNLQAGSTTTGNITATNNGTRTIAVAGTLAGGYDATGGANTAVDNFTLNAGGSVSGAIALGDGNDSFSYLGGTLGSTVDGGAGTDGFFVNMGSSTNATLDQANFTNFENFYLTTGNLTLTGSRSGGAGWTVSGGNATTFILNGSLTNITGTAVTLTTPDLMFVQSGAQLSATGDVIYSSGTGNNIQNSGTITSGTGASSAIAIGSGTVDNYGTITYAAGGSITTQGNGILASTNQLSLGNHTGASLIGRWDGARANNGAYVVNDGLIRGDRFAGVEITGTSVVYNNATGRIYGATGEGAGLLINGGAVQVTNAGQIVGAGTAGIYNGGAGLLSVSNSGTIGSGTLDGSNNFVAGAGTGIYSAWLSAYNSGTISASLGAIQVNGSLALSNVGTIATTGAIHGAVESSSASATIRNSGTITAANYSGVMMMAGGNLTNAVGGTITGGTDVTFGAAVFSQGFSTINNYGTLTSSTGAGIVLNGNNPIAINLYAGSSTGSITGGNADETLSIYNGQVNGSAVTQTITDPVSGTTSTMTLQNAGTIAAATYGAINLGTGNDTLQLRGTGTGAQAGSFSLATSTGAENFTKLDTGTWTLTGAAITPGIRINAGNGTPSGTLIFNGTSGLTGTIYVNGSLVVANTAGAFGTATVHMADPTVQFAASGIYSNPFVLDVGMPLNGDPSVFNNTSGGMVSLTGAITTGSGTNAAGQTIDASQSVTFSGGIFNVTNTGNSWTGVTTINSGATLQGSTSSISGSSIVDNGTLAYNQSTTGTVSSAISGTGQLQVSGTGMVTLTGFNTYTGLTSVSGTGTRLQIGNGAGSGRVAGTISVGSGSSVIFSRNDGYNFTNAINGAGDIEALGTLTLSGAITSTGNLTIDSATGGTVTLAGTRSSGNASAVTLGGTNAGLTVASTSSIAGGQYLGVRINGTGNTLTNLGTIANTGTGGDAGYGAGVGVASTSGTTTITNGSTSNSTAAISGQNGGINHLASGGVVATGLLTVNNYGLVNGTNYNGIENQGGSGALTVNNYSGGRIIGQGNGGGGNGIGMGGTAALTLTNAGLIVGRTNGIGTSGTVNITNQNGGIIAAGTLSSGTSGSLLAGGGNGIQAAGGTITNQLGGTIRGSFLGGSGSDTNAITSTAALTVNNSGYILGVAFGSTSNVRTNGVYVSGGLGAVTNNNGGLITGGWDGVLLVGGGTVTNGGTIAGNLYNGVENATRINNNLGGRILGVTAGASMQADAIVDNTGTIASASYNSSTNTFTATNGTGLLVSSASVANQFGGTISGATGVSSTGALSLGNSGLISGATYAGVKSSGADSTITNNATISGGNDAAQGYGVYYTSSATGSITNRSVALINGGAGGVYVGGTVSYIDNAGSIVGTANNSRGVYFQNGNAVVTNQGTGVIVGQGWGVQSVTTANINNSGFIGAGTLSGGTSGTFTVNSGGSAVVMNGGYLSNNGGATIVGGTYGVASGGTTAANINNLGTITGGTYAIYLSGTNSDTVSLFDGSVTNGAIALGAGDDTLNWYGGSFGSIDAGAGNDRFAASLSNAATLDLSNITGFETYTLGGGDLTLTGTQISGGGWTVNSGSNLTLDSGADIAVTGDGVILSGTNATLTVDGGSLTATGTGVSAYAVTNSVTNNGVIRSTGAGQTGVLSNGATIDNQNGGVIVALGNGVRIQATAGTITNDGLIVGGIYGVIGTDDYQTLINNGSIVTGTAPVGTSYAYQVTRDGLADGVFFNTGGSVTNAAGAYIGGNANGVSISGGPATINNSGEINGLDGYGIAVNTDAGHTSTITNYANSSVSGGTGSVLLTGDGTINLTNQTNSYLTGNIVSTGNGVRNVDISGYVGGDYDASNSTGVDNVVFHSTGSINNVYLGAGDDSFTYFGGYIGGMVDGGAGNDTLFADFGTGQSGNVTLANFANFENLGLISGDLTIDGSGSTAPGTNIYAGNGTPSGTITFNNTQDLTGDIFVNGGTITTNTAGGFGTGTIHMIDPTATFGATGTYANNISLEVVTPSSANPSTFIANGGVVATLTGAITTSGAAGVDPDQDVTFGGQGTFILTNAANDWSGTTTINYGATLQGTSDTISGGVIVADGALNYVQPASGTVGQNISGNGQINVSGLGAGEVLTFAGTTSVAGGITVLDGSTVANSGTLTAASGSAVALQDGGSFLNSGTTNGAVQVYGVPASSITNSGTINGAVVVNQVSQLTLTNEVGGMIDGGAGSAGVSGYGAVHVINDGGIAGNYAGIDLNNAATVIDNSGIIVAGTIAGGSYTLNPGSSGITLASGGTVHNLAGGTIAGGNQGVGANGMLTLTNDLGGTISGQVGINANSGAMITNAGLITSISDANAIGLNAGGTVINSGTIHGGTDLSSGWGITSSGMVNFTNQAGGMIDGTAGAIASFGGAHIDLQAGSTTIGKIYAFNADSTVNIAGAFTGYVSLGNNDDTLTFDTTATIGAGSYFYGAGGNNTLVLTGAGTASLDLDMLNSFDTRRMDGTGTWTLIGNDSSNGSWLINSGTLAASGSAAIGDSALVTVAAPGTLKLLDSEAIGNLGGSGTVDLGGNLLMLVGGTTSSFDGVITGLGNLSIGSGTGITLSGANTYTGTTTVDGTLTLGASNVLADASTLYVGTSGTLDLGANSDTVASATLLGTVNGSGTLTAAGYGLDGATVNVNLGAGMLYISGNTSTLNGTAAATTVLVDSGTLALGASNRLADAATVTVNANATLDLGANSDTVGGLLLNGTLAGTGTLTAAEYDLTGATVNANLGAGTLINLGGISTLNGSAAATTVSVNDGTLVLGASNRLADNATLVVASSATLDLGANSDTVGLVGLAGTLAGSGTLTATEYDLTGATVDANLGTGTLINVSGNSTLNGNSAASALGVTAGTLMLNGTSAATTVGVNGGTLALGASNRLADNATLVVASGATLDLGTSSDTVGLVGLAGTLAGTGTLTATEYDLTGATVNGNLGTGTLINVSGNSTLNGTSAATTVGVNGGTLALGASNRLADAATVAVASGATLDLGANSDTIGLLALNGTLAGTGTLTASQYQLTGATVNANLGAGTLFNLAGTSTLNGTAGGNVSVQAGTLTLAAANRLADTAIVSVASNATLNLGANSDTVAGLALNGTLAGSGTLTAAEYDLTGATVNANLGAGNLFQVAGNSTLNGTAAAGAVQVQAGTLTLGAANRLADTATVLVASGATLALGANSDTVGALALNGTLAGTGTLTAAQYQLTGATVNANLGTGALANMGGTSTLTGTSAASTVLVQAGTLKLGAGERLANTAILGINSGATFDLAGFTETVGGIGNGTNGGGTLALGAGKLVVTGNADQGFSGNITGSGVFEKQGTGRLTLAGTLGMTGRIDLTAGTLAYSATSAGGMKVQGGTLIGGGTMTGNLTIASGTFSPGGLTTGLLNTVQPIGAFTVGSLNVTGGNLLFDFGGAAFNFGADSIKVTGAATLAGGTVAVNSLSAATSDYRFSQLYTIVQAGTLTGTFGNGSTFTTVANDPNLRWRLRYDLVANAVVLQVQKAIDFNADVAGSGNANLVAVASALTNSTSGNASDEWSNVLNTLAALTPAQRVASYNTFSGEAIADTSTATMQANMLFADLLRQRIGDGDQLSGTAFAQSSLGDVRVAATKVDDKFASQLVAGSDSESRSGAGMWAQGFGSYQAIDGQKGTHDFNATVAGIAAGFEARNGNLTAGVAGGLTQVDGNVDALASTLSGTLYQIGGYASFDNGHAFVSASGNYYQGDFDTARTVSLGGNALSARGSFDSDGYAFGGVAGYRFDLGNKVRLVAVASANQTHDDRSSFTEKGAGGLNLSAAASGRDLFTATGELRLGTSVKTGASVAMPYVTIGVRYNAGDLDTVGNMRFASAPLGTGAFQVTGARVAPWMGTVGTGIDVKANDTVRMGVALEAAKGDHVTEGRASVRIKIGF